MSHRDTLSALAADAEALLLGYAQLLFSRERTVGLLLLLATAVAPRAFLFALFAGVVALLTARALDLAPEQRRSGALLYCALLVGLGASTLTAAAPLTLALVALAAALSVVLTSALQSALGASLSLPVLSLPFLCAYYVLLGALRGGSLLAPVHSAEPLALALPEAPRAFLQGLGGLLFLPRLDAGLLVLVALLRHSRIAASLSVLGFAVSLLVLPPALAAAHPALPATLGLNAMLTAMALGGFWFVPGTGSFLLAACAAALCSLLGAGLAGWLGSHRAPLLIVPFNLTVPLALLVLRQRTHARAPFAVDFTPGTPEQNVAYFRARLERFGALYGMRFGAPFRGPWTCTQSVDGGITHEGAWRHALDFEVLEEGSAFRETGAQLQDFYCYKLPVLAAAGGVVARVIDGQKDNPVGEPELEHNWGNVVVLYHAPGVYSCVAHLSPGTLAVVEGQRVEAGEVLGLCGNSGRSATPHLHFQLQATAAVGAPTMPLALHDAIFESADEAPRMHAAAVPAKGQRARRLAPDPERAKLLRFEYQRPLPTRRTERGRAVHEELVPDLDLLGQKLLRSSTTDAVLFYELGPAGFAVLDVLGDESSVLHLLRVALARVPFDGDDALEWSDRLPLRPFLHPAARPLFDLLSPFLRDPFLAMRYRQRRQGNALTLEGASERTQRDGRPLVETRVQLAAGVGLLSLEVRVRGRTVRVDAGPLAQPEPLAAPASARLSLTQ